MIHRLGKKDEVPVNNAKAIERFEFGCKQDFRNSCFYLGVMYLQGRTWGFMASVTLPLAATAAAQTAGRP